MSVQGYFQRKVVKEWNKMELKKIIQDNFQE